MRRSLWLATFVTALLVPAAAGAGPATASGSVAAQELDAAEAAFEAEDWDAAAALYRELAAENPQQGRFWFLLAGAEYNRKHYREAIEPYERAAELGHSAGTSHYNRACCLALIGETAAAIDAVELAIRTGLRGREDLIRTDTDLNSIRDTPEFRARILPAVGADTSREAGWRIDLDYLTRRVAETHYDPFRHISRADWDREVARISAALPTMKDHEVVVALMQLVVRIGDGHTVVGGPTEGRLAFHALPLQFYDFKDGLFVRAASREYANLVGKRVVRVGKLPVREAMERVATTAQRDNAQQIRWMTPRYLARVEVLDALGVAEGLAAVDVTVVDEKGRETRATVKPEPLRGGHGGRALPPGWVDMAQATNNPVPLWRRDPRRLYTLEYMEEPRIVYAGFHAVLNDSAETLAQFVDRVFASVGAHPLEALVIDVRDNNGGNNFLAREFLERIQASDAVNRRGKLFVIIGRETFSACQNFCNWLDRGTDALFVGEPTGSRPNFVGEGNPIILPYSGLVANASSRFWQDSVSEDGRLWIAPDLVAEMTSQDYAQNRDPALETVLAYLRSRRTATTAPAGGTR
jgi:hypothetical protein